MYSFFPIPDARHCLEVAYQCERGEHKKHYLRIAPILRILMSGSITEVILSLGSNLGNRYLNIMRSVDMIATHAGNIISVSSLYETAPWQFDAADSFYNMVVVIETEHVPHMLLGKLQEIEEMVGRKRSPGVSGYESRVIDIDILYYGSEIINSPSLTIPHPLMHKRLFVLVPLNEVAPQKVHPVTGITTGKMLEACSDNGEVKQVIP